jgi:hypothetical protein
VVNKTADERIATLTAIVRMLERSRYGTRSERLRGETLSEEQHAFVFDEIETGREHAVMAVMTKAVAELPDDVDALKAMIIAMADQRALLEARNDHQPAPDEPRSLSADAAHVSACPEPRFRARLRTEYVERATEWISATVPHQSHQAGRTLAEVNRHARYINLHAGRDHASRTARITSASRSASTSPPARTTTSPITISTMSLRIASKRANLTGVLGAAANGPTTPEVFALRRHAKSCDGSSPFDRAIADTFAPATNVSPTILPFSSSDHDR